MKLLTNKEIEKLDSINLTEEIINIKKILLDFKFKQATKQSVKPHLFRLYKKQLAKILTIRHGKI
jgi:ribosomal protein L29